MSTGYNFIKTVAAELEMEEKELSCVSGGLQNIILENLGDRSIIRISSAEKRTKEALLAEQIWLEHITAAGVYVNSPLLFKGAHRVKEIHLDGSPYLATQYSKLAGEGLNPAIQSHWNASTFEELGRQTGRMHRGSRSFHLNDELRKALISKGKHHLYSELSNKDALIGGNYLLLLEEIEKLPKNENCYGLIHGDLHHGNLLFANEEVYIIDTDDCKYSWFAEDIATLLYHVNWHGKSVHPNWHTLHLDFLKAFKKGYNTEHLLSEVIIEQMPLFLRKREFFLYNLFSNIWNLEQLENWQTHTLERLADNLRNERCPVEVT